MSNEIVKVIKEGIQTEKHECENYWVSSMNKEGSNDNQWVTDRICRICGRVEQVTEIRDTETFESMFEKFYGGDK